MCVQHNIKYAIHGRIQRGNRRSGPPEKNTQKYRVFSNTDPDPLKVTKLPSQHSILNGVLQFYRPAYSDIWIISPLIHLKKNGQSLTPSYKTFWIRACHINIFDTPGYRKFGQIGSNLTLAKFFLKVDKGREREREGGSNYH